MEPCVLCQKAHAHLEGPCGRLLELEKTLKHIESHDKARFQALPPNEQERFYREAGDAARELDVMKRDGFLAETQAAQKANYLRYLAGLLIAWTAEFRTKQKQAT
ncbi:MAG: hypothetical protein Q8P02_00795 [Candidatus Micrarchaeota archaeon]|nr:hypothetical protein [Candidatus Micrarchaeota archaeon]